MTDPATAGADREAEYLRRIIRLKRALRMISLMRDAIANGADDVLLGYESFDDWAADMADDVLDADEIHRQKQVDKHQTETE